MVDVGCLPFFFVWREGAKAQSTTERGGRRSRSNRHKRIEEGDKIKGHDLEFLTKQELLKRVQEPSRIGPVMNDNKRSSTTVIIASKRLAVVPYYWCVA